MEQDGYTEIFPNMAGMREGICTVCMSLAKATFSPWTDRTLRLVSPEQRLTQYLHDPNHHAGAYTGT